jgi:hypothetical protein
VEKIGADFHRLAASPGRKSPFRSVTYYGSGAVDFDWTESGAIGGAVELRLYFDG